jgi:large subunit ribosomal protein L21
MYGVVEIAGHQYKVQPGDLIDVEKLAHEVGEKVVFDKVMFVGGEKVMIGAPTLAGAKVEATIVRQGRGPKILVFKRRPGFWRKRKGHRQCYTGLLITSVADGKGGTAKLDASHKWAKKFLK